MESYELYVGNTGDSECIRKPGILSTQKVFAEGDRLANGEILGFLNVFDKG
jgi:hypothetical protein